MALIKCPKCGKQFSEHALACPQCGASTDEIKAIIKNQAMEDAKKVKHTILSLIFCIVVVSITIVVVVSFK